jgi:hypothetical protein
MTTELNPCPFCGGEAYQCGRDGDTIVCGRCGGGVGPCSDAPSAVSIWNSRTGGQAMTDELRATPAPWMALEGVGCAYVAGPDGDIVAKVYGNLAEEGDAMMNARMIAAAHPMAALAQELATVLSRYEKKLRYTSDEMDMDAFDVLLKARAAGLEVP